MENSETKTQSDTCDRLFIVTDSINQDGDTANEDRFQLNSNRISEKYPDSPSRVKQPYSKPENIKRFKRPRKSIWSSEATVPKIK